MLSDHIFIYRGSVSYVNILPSWKSDAIHEADAEDKVHHL